ncbi:MAG: hypothetical protein ACTS8S_09940, partial [Giesbergeria sp.]
QWRAVQQDLRAQGLALHLPCDGSSSEGVLHLTVLDSVRASQALRGPLADGDPVEVSSGSDVSPDVQFNRGWLNKVLLRHRVQVAAGGVAQHSGTTQPQMDLAAR